MAQQYQVPQFVDVEDKIIGPLTAKQFLMFVVMFLIIGALWTSSLPRQVTIILAVPIILFTTLLVFYKVNGRSFIWYLYAVFHFLFTGKMFLWDRRGTEFRIRMASADIAEKAGLGRARGSAPMNKNRIQSLAHILDTSGKVVDEDAPAPAGF